jgi:DNA-binding PadR family transcriptional regulator
MLELAILGLLKESSMHGYQLKKRLSETLGSFWQVSYGSLYPALKRLQRQGAVEMTFPQEDVARRKNVYRITPEGEEMFRELLERAGHEASEDGGFSVRLAFFQYLKPETRIRLLERRRSFLESRGFDLKRALQTYREKVDGYQLSLMNHQLAACEADIMWLDGLIQVEQREAERERGGRTTRSTRPRTTRTARPPRTPRAARATRSANDTGAAPIVAPQPQPPLASDTEKERA